MDIRFGPVSERPRKNIRLVWFGTVPVWSCVNIAKCALDCGFASLELYLRKPTRYGAVYTWVNTGVISYFFENHGIKGRLNFHFQDTVQLQVKLTNGWVQRISFNLSVESNIL